MTQYQRRRKESALNILQKQLTSGKKPERDVNNRTTQNLVDLLDTDKKRILREIERLEKKLK